MTRLVMLDERFHKKYKVDVKKALRQAAQQRMASVVLSEFSKLALEYPVVLTKKVDTGEFSSVALLGFDENENLFWKGDDWDAIYIPLNILRQPFFIGNKKDGHWVVCCDTENESINESVGECIFDEQGKATEFLNNIKHILSALLNGEEETHRFINTLVEKDLLMPVALDVTFINDHSQRVEGIYSIDEDKFKSLSSDSLYELNELGYLSPIYAMIISLGQFHNLVNRKNLMLDKASQWFKRVAE